MKSILSDKLLSPLAYAVLALLLWPFLLLSCVALIFLVAALWPFAPFVLYSQRKQERETAAAGKGESAL
jgi:hypothetical protein